VAELALLFVISKLKKSADTLKLGNHS